MKKNDIQKLHNKSAAELQRDIVEAKEKLWQASRDIAGGKVKNVHSRKEIRRTIARMLTIASKKAN